VVSLPDGKIAVAPDRISGENYENPSNLQIYIRRGQSEDFLRVDKAKTFFIDAGVTLTIAMVSADVAKSVGSQIRG
jgi:hypothetical protein